MLNLLKISNIGSKQESAVNVNVHVHFGVWQQATGVVTSS